MRNKLFIIFLTFNLYANENFIGETLKYNAGFRIFSAGEAVLSFNWDTLGGDSVYFLNAEIKTNSFLDKFYKVRDRIKAWMSPHDFSLKKVEKFVSEGSYKKKHFAEIDYLKNEIKFGKKSLNIKNRVFDPLSIIYKIRENLVIKKYFFEVNIYDMGKIKPVKFEIDKVEWVEVPYGNFECFLISPKPINSKKLLKNEGQMKVWFTKDEKFIPIKIEQSTNVGTMVMELQEYNP
ncbi:MAG: hypothetical protein CMF96_07925 [Candidatus Marinimicrobia bacterium]|nr:hypothetical protein [Candidatus Neomarinimicrobiota bacterium]|tara:strand:+ start:3657 stop:4358 length:702 start_codon:yes stop_codon:yes gene_type:complete